MKRPSLTDLRGQRRERLAANQHGTIEVKPELPPAPLEPPRVCWGVDFEYPPAMFELGFAGLEAE